MSPTPRQSIDPSFLEGLNCPICGHDALQLKSMERFPDYVACSNCRAQFVAEEGGERVMYGEIPATYPRTRRFALQQWVWPEAIARRAAEERSEQPPTPSAPAEDAPAAAAPPGNNGATAPPITPTQEPEGQEPQEQEAAAPDADQTPAETSPPWQPPQESEPEPPAGADSWLPETEAPLDEEPSPPPSFEEGPESEPDELAAEQEASQSFPDWLGEPDQDEQHDDLAGFDLGEGDEFDEDEEDLLADLWSDEADVPDSDVGDVFETDLEAEPFDLEAPDAEAETDLSADLWSEAEQDAADGAPEAEPEEPEFETYPSEFSEEEVAALQWTGEARPEREEPQPTEGQPPADQAPQEEAEPADETQEAGPAEAKEPPRREAKEPPAGVRHRVVLQTSKPALPDDMCAHCTQSPTVSRLSVPATVVRSSGLGERQVTTFRVPICADCKARVNARTEEQQTARLQAHLISVLVALILVVSALAFQIVELEEPLALDIAALALLAFMGYAVPAAFLLLRASRLPKPADARYVETTLRVPSDTEGMETAFEWRSPDYAAHFRAANDELASGNVTEVKEREYESPGNLEAEG